MKELDLLLTRFLETEYAGAAPDLQVAFGELLECQDPLIHAWCLGREQPPTPALSALIRRITAAAGNDR